jgi:hypothetical protein
MGNAYIFFGKPEEKRSLGRLRITWELKGKVFPVL